ncbi:MAG TPA: hypothetical protein DCS15_01070 [Flavobacteriales bacterium]|jgi:hypothetical protein|nr:hypothetical protein [Salibacteraceae bacterium]HAS35047.1 hypothetical protein [Flavobacteriales bacterium]
MKNSIAIGLILGFGLSVAQAQQDSTEVTTKDDFKTSLFKKAPDSSKLKPIPFQVTFFTPLGTNGWDYEQFETNLSVNIIAGHNGAVNGLEFGGFWNSDRHYMHGLQLAGFGNSVFGDVNGIQGAGFINVDMKSFHGVQGAGFLNHVHKNFHGIQLAGFSNSVLGTGLI